MHKIFQQTSTFFVLVLAILATSCGTKETPQNNSLPTPNTSFTTDGITIGLYDFAHLKPFFTGEKGKVKVINFWATWCKPCVEELPYFEKMAAAYKDKGIELTLISLDFEEQAKTKLIPFMQKKNIQSQVLVLDDPDADTWINAISPEWSGAIPATLIIGEDGKTAFYEQQFDYASLCKVIDEFLK